MRVVAMHSQCFNQWAIATVGWRDAGSGAVKRLIWVSSCHQRTLQGGLYCVWCRHGWEVKGAPGGKIKKSRVG